MKMRLSERLQRINPVWIAVFFAVVIALCIYGVHLFDLMAPGVEDVRSHIFKIDLIYSHVSHGAWPQWISYWYTGFPFDKFYPPGFYVIGAALTFIFKQSVVAYKFLMFLTMISSGLVVYRFARKILKFGGTTAVFCLVAYESCTPLWMNYLYGTGPNLLGWSVSFWFLTEYISRVTEGKTLQLRSILFPGLLLGIAVLIHPFPVIFVSMAVVTFHIIWQLHNRQPTIKTQLLYFIKVYICGVTIGAYYWLPAILTFNYASSIYTFTEDAWPGGIYYLLALFLISLIIGIVLRRRFGKEFRLDFTIACLLISAILGFGATRFLPFGLSSMLHEFRFATMMAPVFAILIFGFLLERIPNELDKRKLKPALLITVCLLGITSIMAYFVFSAKVWLYDTFIFFAVLFIPIFIILFVVLNQKEAMIINYGNIKNLRILTAICLVLLTCIIPINATWSRARIERLFIYVDNYLTPEYAKIMEAVQDGRLIIPMRRGYLTEGDSAVTFGWKWGVETINGPYNQGDPKFFKYTVHLEWEERWLYYLQTRLNLMQEGDAEYIMIRGIDPALPNDENLVEIEYNSYGRLFKINQDITRVDSVTPILLDVQFVKNVTEFFNVLMPQGYKLVLVDVNGLDEDIKDSFDYILTDDASKVSEYAGKTVFLLNDTEEGTGVTTSNGVVNINVPVTVLTDNLFYHGNEGDVKAWGNFESSISARAMYDGLTAARSVGDGFAPYIEAMEYEPADYQYSDNEIRITSKAGFTLVKDSYFPYWGTEHGSIIETTQGFMLVYSDYENITVKYFEPAITLIAAITSICTLIASSTILLIIKKGKRTP